MTGPPVININAGQAVKTAFIQAFCYALIVIAILLWLILRSAKALCIVLSPLDPRWLDHRRGGGDIFTAI